MQIQTRSQQVISAIFQRIQAGRAANRAVLAKALRMSGSELEVELSLLEKMGLVRRDELRLTLSGLCVAAALRNPRSEMESELPTRAATSNVIPFRKRGERATSSARLALCAGRRG